MGEKLIKSIDLENRLTLELYDASRKIAADRWLVSLLARLEIPVRSMVGEGHAPETSIEEIERMLGERVVFEHKQDRNFIDEEQKAHVLKELYDSFVSSAVAYLSNPDFAKKYIMKRYTEMLNKQSWHREEDL